jgi:hypothetical protein
MAGQLHSLKREGNEEKRNCKNEEGRGKGTHIERR